MPSAGVVQLDFPSTFTFDELDAVVLALRTRPEIAAVSEDIPLGYTIVPRPTQATGVPYDFRPQAAAGEWGLSAIGAPYAWNLNAALRRQGGADVPVTIIDFPAQTHDDVPVTGDLDLKALAQAAGGKRATLADRAAAERSSGYVRGGISPLGQRKRLPTVVDDSATALDLMYVSAGRRGLQVSLAPADLLRLTDAITAAIRI